MVPWLKTIQIHAESVPQWMHCFCRQHQISHQQTQRVQVTNRVVCSLRPRVSAWNGSVYKHEDCLTNGQGSVTFPSAKANRSHRAECLVWRPSCFMCVINELHLLPLVCNLWQRLFLPQPNSTNQLPSLFNSLHLLWLAERRPPHDHTLLLIDIASPPRRFVWVRVDVALPFCTTLQAHPLELGLFFLFFFAIILNKQHL